MRELAVVVIPFATGGLDRLQDRPHRIDHRIQRAGDTVVERGLAVPEFAEQMLPAVGERPELRKPEKPAVALDGVNRAEHARQPLRVRRIGLQREQVLVELIEVFTRLDEKLRNELAVVGHPFPAVAAGRGAIDRAGRGRPVIYGDFAACPSPAIIPPEARRDRDDPDPDEARKNGGIATTPRAAGRLKDRPAPRPRRRTMMRWARERISRSSEETSSTALPARA